jgi:hypothetical protein
VKLRRVRQSTAKSAADSKASPRAPPRKTWKAVEKPLSVRVQIQARRFRLAIFSEQTTSAKPISKVAKRDRRMTSIGKTRLRRSSCAKSPGWLTEYRFRSPLPKVSKVIASSVALLTGIAVLLFELSQHFADSDGTRGLQGLFPSRSRTSG